jgi:hypothetical protein
LMVFERYLREQFRCEVWLVLFVLCMAYTVFIFEVFV